MGRKYKTHTLFGTQGTSPRVLLPSSDSRKPRGIPKNEDTAQEEGTTRASAISSSNDHTDAATRHPQISPIPLQEIRINIPSSGRYPDTAGSKLHKGADRSTSTKVGVKAPDSQTAAPKQFRINPSGKAKVFHASKPRLSSNSRRQTMNPPTSRGSRYAVNASPPTSLAPPHPATSTSTQGSNDPRTHPDNTAVQKAAIATQELAGEGARRTSPSNIYSNPPSHHHTDTDQRGTSSSHSWNEFATMESAQKSSRPPSHSPQKGLGSQPHPRNMATRQSPSNHPQQAMRHRSNGSPATRRWPDWSSWPELRVRVFGLTPDITTSDMWRCFSREGTIITIELFEDARGTRDGKGLVRFRPPPAKPFWQAQSFPVLGQGTGVVYVRLEIEPPRQRQGIKSPLDNTIVYPETMTMNAESVDFGIMYEPETMMIMHTIRPTKYTNIQFRLSMRYKEIIVEMTLELREPLLIPNRRSRPGKHDREEIIRFKVPFSQLEVIHQIPRGSDKVELLISLETPPRFYRKVSEAGTHDDGKYWTEQNAWFRQTDIVYDPSGLRSASLTLKKTKPVIDLGRWTTYRVTLDMSRNDQRLFDRMRQALRDHNIDIKPVKNFKFVRDREPAVWEYIDKPLDTRPGTRHALEELIHGAVPHMSFLIRYQLEVCISQGLLNEHNLTRDFVAALNNTEATKAQDLLEYVANQKKRVWNPLQIFSMRVTKSSSSRSRIPSYCAYVRSATVTPSTVYYNTPTVETSNRVIRQYAEYSDRFLRVRFTDEKNQARINPTDKETMNEVFTRVKRTMANGITIGDRTYDFLAFGNSQFREHGAYFFAPIGHHITASHIRQWMGKFSDIKVIAKHAARLGQCFSTTRAINCTKVDVVETEDVRRNGYTFSDGVGKLSPMLAAITASELGIMTPEPPSVFQFRLGGCKGVLAVSPVAKLREIHIRESQYKFPAMHEGLEIIRWSQMSSANLNRQLILVLTALGVADDIFISKLKMQLTNLEQAMTDGKVALTILQKDIDPNQMTLVLAGMIIDGFFKTREPFLSSILHLWRAWSIKYLKEKARLSVADGALLLGCLDETATLRGHFDVDQVRLREARSMEEKTFLLPEVFVQLSQGLDKKPQVVTGPMLLARNPSLHPGDIRVVRGVDVPDLRHLKDCVVLPQTGDRDIPGMCSGGDLDGDDYLVMWDKDLLPAEWNHEPMDYTAPKAVEISRNVRIDDLTSFFVTYMKNNTLPSIANSHVAQADILEDGVKDPKCLQLAALHSMAVDYVKTGTPARMKSDLRPRKWPHFMEKDYKPAEQIYHSKKVLGQLYDQVDRVDFVPTFDMPFDSRVLKAYSVSSDMLRGAAEVKQDYDAAIRRIMAQHEIKTEFEVWSTFVLQHSNDSRDYKFHEEIGNLSQSLKDQFRDVCREKAGAQDFESILQFVAAMYTVTAQEMDLALGECRQTVIVNGVETPLRKMVPASMPLMSFPWLFPHYLGRIANGDQVIGDIDASIIEQLQGETKRTLPKKETLPIEGEDTVLETAKGITHRGQNLILFDDWVDVHPDTEEIDVQPDTDEQQAAPKASALSSLSGSGSQLIDISDGGVLLEDRSSKAPDLHINRDLHSLASSSDFFHTDEGLGESEMRPSQLFRNDEADIGTISRILTPDSSETTSRSGPSSIHGGTSKKAEPPTKNLPSPNNDFVDLLGIADWTEPNGVGNETELPANPNNDIKGAQAAGSKTTNEPDTAVNQKDGVEGSDEDANEAEEVEVRLNLKPSYLDRLSLLSLD